MMTTKAYLFVLPLLLCFSQAQAQLTHTQTLIEREIFALGGRSESSNEIVWAEFQGEKFRPFHFEMLCHLPSLRWFSAIEVVGNPECLSSLKSLHKLQRLDLESCGDTVEGIVYLRNHPSLNEVQIEDARVSRSVTEALASLPKLRILIFSKVEFDRDDVKRLSELCKRCTVTFDNVTGLKEDDLATLVNLNNELRRQRAQTKSSPKGVELLDGDKGNK